MISIPYGICPTISKMEHDDNSDGIGGKLNGNFRFLELKRLFWEAVRASQIDYWFFQVGLRFSKKALRPSVASSVFINPSR